MIIGIPGTASDFTVSIAAAPYCSERKVTVTFGGGDSTRVFTQYTRSEQNSFVDVNSRTGREVDKEGAQLIPNVSKPDNAFFKRCPVSLV